ncbi:putative 4-amino-4-deoxy-L-arabinose-phosphoundecaprenol flippase subunit ArnE [compost metagenome]
MSGVAVDSHEWYDSNGMRVLRDPLFYSIALILASVLVGVFGQLFLKAGVSKLGTIGGAAMANLPHLLGSVATNPLIIAGLACYGLGAAIWIIVLSRVDLSLAYPMLGLGYVFVLLTSWLLFGEAVTPLRWLGALMIVAGVVLVARS